MAPDGVTGRMPGGGMMQMMHSMMGGPGIATAPRIMGGYGMLMHGAMGVPMAGAGMMGGVMLDEIDADGDGHLAPDELRTGLEEKLAEHDADGDGALSLDEFETLHNDLMRHLMVDRFQHLDRDGDGGVTSGEITLPADRMQRMWQWRERMEENWPGMCPGFGAPGDGTGRMAPPDGMGPNMGPRNDSMMNED